MSTYHFCVDRTQVLRLGVEIEAPNERVAEAVMTANCAGGAYRARFTQSALEFGYDEDTFDWTLEYVTEDGEDGAR